MPKMSEPEGKATENGAVGISDAENIRIRRKKQRKTARWGFPMPKISESEGKSNGKRCDGDFRCRKRQSKREKATEKGVMGISDARSTRTSIYGKTCGTVL